MALTTRPPAAPAPAVVPPPPVASPLDRWSDPTAILVAGAVLAVVGLLPTVLRAPVTLPLALLLPGHALLAAIGRPDRALAPGGRVALRVVLSLATVALAVLATGAAFGVSRLSVVGGVWAVVSVAGLAAYRHELPARSAATGPVWTQSGVLLAGGALGLVALVVGALLFLPEARQEPYSRLSVTGTSKSSGTPIVVRSGRTAEVRVQVENGTGKTVRYGVIPAIDGGAAWKARKVSLGPGETWTGTVSGRIPAGACLSRLTIALSAGGKGAGVAPLVLYVRDAGSSACR